MTNSWAERNQRSYSFGPFVLFPERQLLVEGERQVRIGGRALDVLTVLVERPGEVVDKRELISRVWSGIAVDDANLKVNMGLIRRALGETAGPAQYIATVVGRGYRFIAPVTFRGDDSSVDAKEEVAERHHNLPAGNAVIFGRDDSINAVINDLSASRLVSVVGAGGVGKTTVALAAAEKLIGGFTDGVWFVDLASLRDPILVPEAIATAVGLVPHSSNMIAALCTALRDRDMLLVLDNCEHLIDAVAFCSQRILTSAKYIKILTTSREPLSTKSERVRRLAGLDLPLDGDNLGAGEALTYPAIQLFVDVAVDRDASFALRDADVSAVCEICKRLDGVALAIELAATRIDVFSPAELLERLDDRFRLLQGRRAGPERHRTLMALIDWSYDLLSESERAVMRRLSIFVGRFNVGAATAVAVGDGMDQIRVVDELSSLVAKSLVSVQALDTEMSYRMLESTRAYAFDKLAASNEFVDVRRRHAEHALHTARQAKSDIAVLSRSEWDDRYRPKVDDVRDALVFAFSGRGDELLGIRLTVACVPWWERLSLLEECRVLVERALEARYAALRKEHEEVVLLLSKGACKLYTRGPMTEVRADFERALEISANIGAVDLQLESLRGLSQFYFWAGDSRLSLASAQRIQEITKSLGDAPLPRDADGQAGIAMHHLGDLAAARKNLEGFLEATSPSEIRPEISRFEHDQKLEARGALAMVLWLQGFPDQALDMARTQLQETETSGYAVPYSAAILLTSVCIHLYVGDFDETERLLDFADEYTTEHGLTLWKAVGDCMRVKLNIEMGRSVDIVSYRRVLADVRDGGMGLRYPPFLANYGQLLSMAGDHDGALECIDEAMRLYTESGQHWGLPEMLTMKGNFIRAGQRHAWHEHAASCYHESMETARKHGSLTWELRSAIQLADLPLGTGERREAKDLLSAVLARFHEGFWTADLRRARTIIEKNEDLLGSAELRAGRQHEGT